MSLSAPYGSLADPAGSSALVAAVRWVEAVVLGPIATSVAVLAIAALGLMMLTGRVPIRRGATVILGCLVLFCASMIATGIHGAIWQGPENGRIDTNAAAPIPAPPPLPSTQPTYDPYAGAAVPPR